MDSTKKEIPPPPMENVINETDKSPKPTHITNGEYAVLMETNGKECESWFYFIRREGNEENLKYLQHQLEKVEWYIMDDLSTFDLDLEHFVSASTAKEMTKVELNSYAFHRKFDGVLQKIELEFRKKDSDETKICKTFDQLGYGQIEDFINDEDLDSEDLTDHHSSSEDESSEDESSEDESSDNNSSSEEEKEKHLPKKEKKKRPSGAEFHLLC